MRLAMAACQAGPTGTTSAWISAAIILDGATDAVLGLRRLLPRPRQIEHCLRAASGNLGVEQSDVFVVARRVLERQRRLFLQHDVVPARPRQDLLRDARVPVPPEACTARDDRLGLDAGRMVGRRGEVCQQARQLVARSVAVADEQDPWCMAGLQSATSCQSRSSGRSARPPPRLPVTGQLAKGAEVPHRLLLQPSRLAQAAPD